MSSPNYVSNSCVCGLQTITPIGNQDRQMNSQLQHQMLRTLTVMESFYKESINNIPVNETIELGKGFAESKENVFLPHKAFALVKRLKKVFHSRDEYYNDVDWVNALDTLLTDLFIEFEV